MENFIKVKKIVICAKHWKTAQQASNLIFSSLILHMGDTMGGILSDQQPIVYSEQDKLPKDLPTHLAEFIRNYHINTPGLSTACLIAIKASQNKRLLYAISKYKLSCEVYSTASVDLDPFYSENLKLSSFVEDHVRFATSINLAYSAIEDLQLQIKAGANNPSKINGVWNSKVKEDLGSRLLNSGININEQFLWSVRGTLRKIDKVRPPISVSKPYRSSKTVRDVEVNIIDALNDASWLRSKVSAHGASHLTPSLSPYDVANVQHLTRRLILESLGYWKFMKKMKFTK
ncbi:MAG: hypothetical protein U5Q03_07905 [Bacteroidota bacterium]|nr:hypothetical protein [Bacteroidota bacterium]